MYLSLECDILYLSEYSSKYISESLIEIFFVFFWCDEGFYFFSEEHLSKYRGRLRHRESRVIDWSLLSLREVPVDRMTEFMGDRRDVSELAREVQQDE